MLRRDLETKSVIHRSDPKRFLSIYTPAKFSSLQPLLQHYCIFAAAKITGVGTLIFRWIIHFWYFCLIWVNKASLALFPQIQENQKYQKWIIRASTPLLRQLTGASTMSTQPSRSVVAQHGALATCQHINHLWTPSRLNVLRIGRWQRKTDSITDHAEDRAWTRQHEW